MRLTALAWEKNLVSWKEFWQYYSNWPIGQFENLKIKTKNAKLWNTPLADGYFKQIFKIRNMLSKK